MIDLKKFKKDRFVCKTCYNKNKRKTNKIILTPNDLKTTSNKTVKNRKNKLKAGSNIENVNNNNNDIVSTYENRAIVIIGPRNVGKTYYNGAESSSQIDEFFTRGRHEDLDVYYISPSYFALPRQSIRNNSDRLILFKQTLRDVQSMYYDIGAYDMKYDEFKEMCHKAWSERFNYLCIDMTKNRDNGKYRIFNESKNTYIECVCETEAF